VGHADFVPRERALDEFRVQMASYAPDLVADEDLLALIPASFQISLSESIPASQQVERIKDLSTSLQATAGIEEVRYGQEWIKKYSAVLSAARASVGVLGAILLLAALLVIGNSVRASIDARRNEIEVLELVGATSWMIRKPFLLEGAVLGFFSALSALIASFAVFALVRNLIRDELSFLQLAEHLTYLSGPVTLICLLTGTFLGFLASYLCVRRVNTGWAAAGGPR
jgi:cell division transport system permease protein